MGESSFHDSTTCSSDFKSESGDYEGNSESVLEQTSFLFTQELQPDSTESSSSRNESESMEVVRCDSIKLTVTPKYNSHRVSIMLECPLGNSMMLVDSPNGHESSVSKSN